MMARMADLTAVPTITTRTPTRRRPKLMRYQMTFKVTTKMTSLNGQVKTTYCPKSLSQKVGDCLL